MIHHLTTAQDFANVDGKPAKFLIVETAAGFAVGYCHGNPNKAPVIVHAHSFATYEQAETLASRVMFWLGSVQYKWSMNPANWHPLPCSPNAMTPAQVFAYIAAL